MKAIVSAALLILLLGCIANEPIPEGIGKDGRPYRGAQEAKLTIYEYSDFECPFCGKVQPTLEAVLRNYKSRVRLEYRHYPLSIHPHARQAAKAAICAEEQGKFWQMHDKLFANQNALEGKDLENYARQIGLDVDAFSACLSSQETEKKLEADIQEALLAGVAATPTFKIGETEIRGAQPEEAFKKAIDIELAKLG